MPALHGAIGGIGAAGEHRPVLYRGVAASADRPVGNHAFVIAHK